MARPSASFLLLPLLCAALACAKDHDGGLEDTPGAPPAAGIPQCAPDDGGITLPDGVCALVVADGVGPARHIAVRSDGVVFAALRNRRGERGGLLALRDTTGDGVADVRAAFGDDGGTGLELVQDTLLYFAADDAIVRYRVPLELLAPAAPPDTIVSGLPSGRSHAAKAIVVRGGDLLVNHGSPSNSCQEEDRQPRSPGRDPCPELETRAGVWRFDATRTGQTFRDGSRFATGTRNLVAMDAGEGGVLYAVQHGRDQLGASWGFTDEASAQTPAEEMFRIEEGDDFGWPYCYYDPELEEKILAPEYGGDGTDVGRCAEKEDPIAHFPAHWAPNALLFYTGDQLPPRYHGGAFVAFHGSWNRAPLPQGGYNVVFLPFEGGSPAGEWEVFADGFAGPEVQPSEAAHRPAGLAQGPDGSLYVSDDQGGRIWRIMERPRAR